MERETEELMVEDRSRKRDCPEPPVEIKLEREGDLWWDNILKEAGAKPVSWSAEHAENKSCWRKTEGCHLVTESEEEEDKDDDPDRQASRYRDTWIWSGYIGFEDTTSIPSMRYSLEPPITRIFLSDSLQVFAAKIGGIRGGFHFPLDVYGMIAIRDSADQKRNVIFHRRRVECQTLTEMDPYLALTGPTRAVVVIDPLTIEVYLKVKGAIESEDRTLCFLGEELICYDQLHSCLLHRTYTSKFSTLDFTLGHILSSVESTIFVRVIEGSWPDGFHGQFAACTVSADHDDCGDGEVSVVRSTPSVDQRKLVLLGFRDKKLPVIRDGEIELSRTVVSIQLSHSLKVSVKAWKDDSNAVEDVAIFKSKKAGKSSGPFHVSSCKMEVTVFWSLISDSE